MMDLFISRLHAMEAMTIFVAAVIGAYYGAVLMRVWIAYHRSKWQ